MGRRDADTLKSNNRLVDDAGFVLDSTVSSINCAILTTNDKDVSELKVTRKVSSLLDKSTLSLLTTRKSGALVDNVAIINIINIETPPRIFVTNKNDFSHHSYAQKQRVVEKRHFLDYLV